VPLSFLSQFYCVFSLACSTPRSCVGVAFSLFFFFLVARLLRLFRFSSCVLKSARRGLLSPSPPLRLDLASRTSDQESFLGGKSAAATVFFPLRPFLAAQYFPQSEYAAVFFPEEAGLPAYLRLGRRALLFFFFSFVFFSVRGCCVGDLFLAFYLRRPYSSSVRLGLFRVLFLLVFVSFPLAPLFSDGFFFLIMNVSRRVLAPWTLSAHGFAG